MNDLDAMTRPELQNEIARLEQALADVRLERSIALSQRTDCADLVANKPAWDRDEQALLQRIAALKAAMP